jgi:LPXTG-motif cell wall-anchored protein
MIGFIEVATILGIVMVIAGSVLIIKRRRKDSNNGGHWFPVQPQV